MLGQMLQQRPQPSRDPLRPGCPRPRFEAVGGVAEEVAEQTTRVSA
jgi:hypothetical protein